jgi:hypothetical protein
VCFGTVEEGTVVRVVSEADWRIFREIRGRALEAFAEQVLREVDAICSDQTRGAHERYLEVHRLLDERDRSLAKAFDHVSRSRMLEHLAAMSLLGLVSAEDLADLSPETQEYVRVLSD